MAAAAGLATVIAIVGTAIVLFFNPVWVAFEQERVGVPAITGYTTDQVNAVTGELLADVSLGDGRFDVAVNGTPVLDAAERSHMVDVRNVVRPAALVYLGALVVLAALVVAYRRHRWLWRSIVRTAAGLAALGVAIGVILLFFFDAAFLLFHLVFFPQGNFSFDPRTQRLVQLFPDQFWSETAIAIAVAALVLAVVVVLVGRGRLATLRAAR